MSARPVVGAVLAGGASRRMGGSPKALERIGERTLLENAVERLRPQVDRVVVNGPEELREHVPGGVALVPDPFSDRRGPLAGVLAVLGWCERNEPDAVEVVTVPVDTPFFPTDLAEKLTNARDPQGNAIARADGKLQPTFGAWNVEMREQLQSFLLTSDTVKVLAFTERHACGFADFPDLAAFDNANTPDDLARIQAAAKR